MEQPALTLMLLTYEHEAFVREAVRGVLAQDCPPAEILIADDCSRDGTFAIIEEECRAYRGSHSVRCWRNSENLGPGNLVTTAAQARGEFVVMFHGDDISVPSRARTILETFRRTGASVITSDVVSIDAEGRELRSNAARKPDQFVPPEAIVRKWSQLHLGATMAWSPDVFAKFPPWSPERIWGASDHFIPFRGALLGGTYYLDQPLVRRRLHERNMRKDLASGSGEGRIEVKTAYSIGVRLFLLDDLAALPPEESAALREQLREALHEDLRTWVGVRSALFYQGKRPDWIERETFFERYKWRFVARKLQGRGRALRRRISSWVRTGGAVQ